MAGCDERFSSEMRRWSAISSSVIADIESSSLRVISCQRTQSTESSTAAASVEPARDVSESTRPSSEKPKLNAPCGAMYVVWIACPSTETERLPERVEMVTSTTCSRPYGPKHTCHSQRCFEPLNVRPTAMMSSEIASGCASRTRSRSRSSAICGPGTILDDMELSHDSVTRVHVGHLGFSIQSEDLGMRG